jgi:SAM-dependent methyltransferase
MNLSQLVMTAYAEHGSIVPALAAAYVAALAVTAFVTSRWFDAVIDRLTFDRRHNVDTAPTVSALGFLLNRHSRPYAPVAVRTVRSILAALRDEVQDFVFIDIGSGKGRALLIASEYPFRKIVGIEHVHELAEASRRNVSNYRNGARRCGNIEVREMDARDFQIPDGDCVLFLYNPFGQPLLGELAEKIRKACATRQQELYIVYVNPSHTAIFDALPCLRRVLPSSANTDYFTIYRRVRKADGESSDSANLMAA